MSDGWCVGDADGRAEGATVGPAVSVGEAVDGLEEGPYVGASVALEGLLVGATVR